jgi:hypothetical protein
MSPSVARAKEEFRHLFVAALFFATGFSLIIVAERLFVREASIDNISLLRAVVGGLIVAKILLLVDLLPFVHAFPEKPLVHNILWKSSLYVAASLVFRYIEPFIKNLFKGMGLSASHSGALQELMLPRIWAVEIWLAMLLVTFVTMQELTRVVGKQKMKQLFFGSGGNDKPAPETSVRRAA